MRVVILDFETFFDSKSYTLSRMGPIEYIRDVRFEPQMVGISINGQPAQVYLEPTAELLKSLIDFDNDIIIGHNASGFDALILSEYYGLLPKNVWDSIFMMRWTGISRVCGESHKALTEYLGNGVKQAGTVVSDGKHWPDDFTPGEQAFFRQYCADDVNQCRDNCKAMLPYLTEDACRFMSITARMATEPAFIIDKNILQEYISGQDSKKQDALKSLGFANITDMLTQIRSAEKFAGLLRGLGVDPPMKWSARKKAEDYAFAKTDAAFIDLLEHEDARVRELVRARLDMNGSGVESKAKTLLKFAEGDKELPIILSAWKAHTSRYSGGTTKETASDGIQMQNLTKRNPVHKKIRQAITVHDGMTVVACDSSQIEARCLAWIAGQNNLVEQFREGRDPYAELAAKFGSGYTAQEIHDGAKAGDKEKEKLRNVGKMGILSCLSGTTQVLTDTGWKYINSISKNDKLWDGENWVCHNGLICNGMKRVINLDGVSMTPDHLIWNGISWNRADEYLNGRCSLSQALSIGTDSLKTLELGKTAKVTDVYSIRQRAKIAITQHGFLNCLSVYALQKHVVIAQKEIFQKNLCVRNILHQTQEQYLENLQLCGHFAEVTGRILNAWKDAWKLIAPAVKQGMLLRYITCCRGRQHVAIHAQNVKRKQRDKNYIKAILIFALIPNIGGDYSIELQHALPDVQIQKIERTTIMGVEAYKLNLLTEENFYRILSHWMDGIILIWKLIGLIIMGITKKATCNFAQKVKMEGIKEALQTTNKNVESLRTNVECYENVYDIMNSGPNNRFLIKTNSGALLVHNCGYGIGAGSFARKLWTEGTKLAGNSDDHEQEATKYHAIYRQENPAIVAFWKQCQNILADMVAGRGGVFGGPYGDLFEYGLMPILGNEKRMVPSILLPSGYMLRYPGLRYEKGEFVADVQDGNRSYPKHIYGGLLTENVVSAFAFQILMWQGCRLDERGVALKGNNHDCWYTVVPDSQKDWAVAQMTEVMSMTPAWADGLPIACECKTGNDFSIC